jgi:hypothetical protein
MEITGSWTDAFYLTDQYNASIVPGNFGTILSFTDIYRGNFWSNSITSNLTFHDTYHTNTPHSSWTDTLSFNDSYSRIINTIITANWQLQDFYNPILNYWQNTLNFIDHFGTRNDIEINLVFTDQYNSVVWRTGQWIDYMVWNPASGFDRPYNQFIGYRESCNVDPIGTQVTFAFAGNSLLPAMSINIDNPLIGDKHSLIYTRTETKSRTGNLVIISKPYWPRLQQLELQFTWIRPNDSLAFQNFLSATAGLQITFVDWHGQLWNGLILNPDAEFSQLLH